MQVSIEHKEVHNKPGLFSSAIPQYAVHVTVHFEESEMNVIQKQKLGPQRLIERIPDSIILKRIGAGWQENFGDHFDLKVNNLIKNKPDVFVFDTIVEARDYEEQLKTRLRDLKNVILESAEVPKSTSFEL